jgi:hypothetical protein
MNPFQKLAEFHGMTEDVWGRHANPWSAWTRVPVLPALCFFVWAREWMGWWSLPPIAALLVWTWWNPRIFPEPATTDSWASRAVMGERIWLNRYVAPIPDHHAVWANLLVGVSATGLPPLLWGLLALDLGWLLLGLVLTIGGKMWFLDRMVWLFEDMAAVHPEYAAWRR